MQNILEMVAPLLAFWHEQGLWDLVVGTFIQRDILHYSCPLPSAPT